MAHVIGSERLCFINLIFWSYENTVDYPTTVHPRCPDCVRAEPAVRRAFVAEQQRLLVCDVGTREAWKASTPAHPLRSAPWALTCIPSLVALEGWAAGQPARAKGNSAVQPRLDSELESCTDPDSCQVSQIMFIR
jgi:hypothetical protein